MVRALVEAGRGFVIAVVAAVATAGATMLVVSWAGQRMLDQLGAP